MFEELKIEYDGWVKSRFFVYFQELYLIVSILDQPRQEIAITLQDGSQRQGISWETSPMDVAKQISKSLSERIVIAKVSI